MILRGFWRLSRTYLFALAFVGLFTGVIAVVRASADVSNVSMLYLLAVLATAVLFGSSPAIFAAVASFIAFNLFFLHPRYSLSVADDEEWVALGLLLASGVVTGQLASVTRRRAQEAERREKEAIILYDLVRMMSAPGLQQALADVAERLRAELGLSAVLLAFDSKAPGRAEVASGDPEALKMARDAASLAEMVLAAGRSPTPGERGAPGRWIRVVSPIPRTPEQSLTGGRVRTVPVQSEGTKLASLILVRNTGAPPFSLADDRVLSAVAHQLGLALRRIGLQHEATEAEALRRTDELRTALINAVSHDLRTPLSSILASAGSLLQSDVAWTDEQKRGFAEGIVEEARRLNRLVSNLLDLSRIESGNIRPEKGWYDLSSLVSEVAGRLRWLTAGRDIKLEIPEDLPPVHFDYVEIDQVVSNLLENAVAHTPPGSEVNVSVRWLADQVEVSVTDCGPGISTEALPHVFKPFYSGARHPGGGAGLGLAVARGLVEAHGGRIGAENRPEGGARFAFTLPLGERPAEVA